MARNTQKNFKDAIRFPFSKRFGYQPNLNGPIANNVDHDFDNGFQMTWSNSADTASVPALSVDSDSMVQTASSVAIDNARGSQQFYMNANAGLATQTFFIADRPTVITGIEYVHATAGTDGSAVTAAIFKDTGTNAPGGGSTVQVGTFNCKGTINTPQLATLVAVDGSGAIPSVLQLASGDRLTIVFAGTLTTLAGVAVTVFTTPGAKEEVAAYNMNANASIATQAFFTASKDCVISSVNLVWSAAGTDAGAVTIDVQKDTGTTAPGSGTTVLTAAVSAKTAANTVAVPALSATAANLKLAAGDRLTVKYTGTLTALAGVVVCVYLQASSAVVGTPLAYYGQQEAAFTMNANGTQATQAFFIADRDYEIVDVSLVWATANASGTFDLTVDKGTTAPGSGASALSGTVATTSTANTTAVAGLNTSRRLRLVSAGDRLTVKLATVGALAGLNVNVSLLPR